MTALDRLPVLLLEKLHAFWISSNAITNLLAIAAILLFTFMVDRRAGRDHGRYFSANALTDALYTVFSFAGFYYLLVSGPVFKALNIGMRAYVPLLPLNLLRDLPVLVQAIVVTLAMDLGGYWVHRLSHANRFLWTFHSIHHSQEKLTPLTNSRFHFGDLMLYSLAAFVVTLLLGAVPEVSLVAAVVFLWQNMLAHSGFDWSFGPLDWILVSPRHHRVHHSVEIEHVDRNFGQTFSCWDYLFGTVVLHPRAPRAYGLPGAGIPESFFRQLGTPFTRLARELRPRHPAPAAARERT